MLLPLPDNACNLCGRREPGPRARASRAFGGCTGGCVRGGLGPRDYALEGALLLELQQLEHGKQMTLERALADLVVFEDETDRNRARNAARRLAARGQLQILQGGVIVPDGEDSPGPIEVRLPTD